MRWWRARVAPEGFGWLGSSETYEGRRVRVLPSSPTQPGLLTEQANQAGEARHPTHGSPRSPRNMKLPGSLNRCQSPTCGALGRQGIPTAVTLVGGFDARLADDPLVGWRRHGAGAR